MMRIPSIALTSQRVCGPLTLALALTGFSGCPRTPAPSSEAPSAPAHAVPDAGSPEAPAAVAQDSPDAVAALEAAGVALRKDQAGRVVAANCKNAKVGDEEARHFTKLPALTSLLLENSLVTDEGLGAVLEQLPQLTELSLRRCTNVTSNGLVHLRHVPNLERLHLLYSFTNNAGLAHVAPLTKLRLLDLRGCTQVSDAGLEHLRGLVNLVDLKFRNEGVTDAGLAHLAGLTRVRLISLEDCRISDDGLPHLAQWKDLRRVNVMRTFVGDDGLAVFAELPLQELNLRSTMVAGPGLERLRAATDSLTSLDLSELYVDNEGMAFLAPFRKLQSLSLVDATMDDEGAAVLGTLAELEELDLQGCASLTSASAEHLSQLPRLRTLNLADTALDDAGLEQLAAMKSLKRLQIGRTRVSDAGAARLREALPELEIVR